MMTLHRLSTRCAIVAACLFVARPHIALGQERATAVASRTDEELLAEGVGLRKEGRDAEALAVFERAYVLQPTSRALAQMGLAHQALAQWVEAERALAAALDDSTSPWISRYRGQLDESLSVVRDRLGWLEVETNVAGAEVGINDERFGSLPLDRRVRVVAGDVRVRLRALGYDTIERALRIDPQSQVHVEFLFAPRPAPEAKRLTGVPIAPMMPVRPAASSLPTRVWIPLAAAGVLALAGGAAMVTREVEANIYDDATCAPSAGVSRYQRCGSNRDVGSAAQTLGFVAFSGAGVAAAISGVLFWGHWQPGQNAKGQVGCVAAPMGFACRSTF